MRAFLQRHFSSNKYRVKKARNRYKTTSDRDLASLHNREMTLRHLLKIVLFVAGFLFAFIGAITFNLYLILLAAISEFSFIGLMFWRESLVSIEFRRRLIERKLNEKMR